MNNRETSKLVNRQSRTKRCCRLIYNLGGYSADNLTAKQFSRFGPDDQPDLYRLGFNDTPIIIRDKSYRLR
jgi:hypothetical protein